MTARLFTQVYCLQGEQVLMMKRNKQPNLGLWVAPGGKIKIDEGPLECALRELQEETNLTATEIELRGITSHVLPGYNDACLQFMFLATATKGDLHADLREGDLRWVLLTEVYDLPMPISNRRYMPRILDSSSPIYQAKFFHDEQERVVDWIEFT